MSLHASSLRRATSLLIVSWLVAGCTSSVVITDVPGERAAATATSAQQEDAPAPTSAASTETSNSTTAGSVSEIQRVDDSAASLATVRSMLQQTIEEPAVTYERISERPQAPALTLSGSFDRTRQAGWMHLTGASGQQSRSEVLVDGVVWFEDSEPANNRVIGLDDESTSSSRQSKADAMDPAWMLQLVDDALAEVVGIEDLGDGIERWFVLADVATLGTLAASYDFRFSDSHNPTGTSFDRVIIEFTTDPRGLVAEIDIDLTGWAEASRPNQRYYRAPARYAEHLTLTSIPAPTDTMAPCSEPTRSSTSFHGSVLQCPIDDDVDIPRFVTIGSRSYPDSNMQVLVLEQLLAELGYKVSLHQVGLAAEDSYVELADGVFDVWAAGWFPVDDEDLAAAHPEGGTVGDRVVRGEPVITTAATSGILVPKVWADTWNVSTVDQINADPELYSQFDSDGNGKGEIPGCGSGWSCFELLEQKAASTWTNLEPEPRWFYTEVERFRERARAGEAAMLVAHTPDPLTELLDVGGLTTYLSIEGSDAGAGERLGEDRCRYVEGACRLGFASGGDLEYVGNAAWMSANPAAATLIGSIRISADDLNAMELAVTGGERDSGLFGLPSPNRGLAPELAAGWIEDHREVVDVWLNQARAVEPDWQPVASIDDLTPDPDEGGSSGAGSSEREQPQEGDRDAWELAVLHAVEDSGALARGDDTEPISIGSSILCAGATDLATLVLHFDAHRDRYVDLDAQIEALIELVDSSCALLPMGHRESDGIVVTPPTGQEWDELIDSAYATATAWGSVDEFENVALRSCASSGGGVRREANGTSIGDGLLSESQLAHIDALVEDGCDLLSERYLRYRLLEADGREELEDILGSELAARVTDEGYECMVAQSASRPNPPTHIDPVAIFAPVCIPELVAEADAALYVSDLVDADHARCAADALVGLATASGSPIDYFSPRQRPLFDGDKQRVVNVLTHTCQLSSAQIMSLDLNT